MRCPVVRSSLPWRAAGGDALGMDGICVAWRCLEVPTLLISACWYLLPPGRLLSPGVQATLSHDHGKVKVQGLYVVSRGEPRPRGGENSFIQIICNPRL